VAGQPFCYAGSVAVSAHAVYVADTCNRRIVRFKLTGEADDVALALPDDGWAIPAGLFADADGLWVARAHQLVRVADGPTAAMSVAEVLPITPPLNGPKSLVR